MRGNKRRHGREFGDNRVFNMVPKISELQEKMNQHISCRWLPVWSITKVVVSRAMPDQARASIQVKVVSGKAYRRGRLHPRCIKTFAADNHAISGLV
jgi:hypothetical protein